MFDLETAFGDWKRSIENSIELGGAETSELESHMRESISNLSAKGLSEQEAFMIAAHRLGKPSELGKEFSKNHSASAWRKRILWMASGYIAINVIGAVLSALSSIAATSLAVAGFSGTATGFIAATVLAIGWIAMLYFVCRLPEKSAPLFEHVGSRSIVFAVAALVGSPLLVIGCTNARARFFDLPQFGQSQLLLGASSWAVHLLVYAACLTMIWRLNHSDTKVTA